MLKKVTIKLDVNEKQLEALKELLPEWQQYTSKTNEKPFEDMTEEKLLEALLYKGSTHTIWKRIKNEQYRQDMITVDELMDDEYLTAAQRKERRQQAQKEGACV
ncbi:MAG: hypothetical protein HDR11_09840 [Lachnospiraceae bacterium]|nr:hypothetical protein [Lachnospiraceae bacterium]MBD5536867.1 hypothetical protein [Lachnospiraceae bacterium]